MNEVSLKPVIDELETLFSKFNKAFFEGKLEKPVITVSPDHTRGAYGWCTAWKAWQDGTKEGGYYEINLCAEYLNRPFEETCGTLLHEMVHLQNLQDNVQDTSRSGSYHNRKFKETAEAHGLTVEKGEKYGWHKTTLNPQAEAFVKSLGKSGFCLVRPRTNPLKGSRKGGGSSSRKYVCPCCGTIIRATKEVHVLCGECEVAFEEQECVPCSRPPYPLITMVPGSMVPKTGMWSKVRVQFAASPLILVLAISRIPVIPNRRLST